MSDSGDSVSRYFKLRVIILVIAVVELQAWIFTNLAVRFGSRRFYSPDLFSRISEEQLARTARHGPLGWPPNDSPRPASSGHLPICGSAFGDSMTYGAEVADDQTWLYLLSLRLGCAVTNYAVSAYGLDQAVLRYERTATEGNFVILACFLK